MNMKKSIAGVMAGAMAVSAMATVVSADQDAISLTYDLKTYIEDVNKEQAKVTVVANYEGSLISEESVKNGYITFGADNGYVRGGAIYNNKGVKIGSVPAKGDWNDTVRNTANKTDLVEFEFTARPFKDIINDIEDKYQTFKATSDGKNTDGAYYDKTMENNAYDMKICTSGNDTIGKFDLRKYDVYSLGYSANDGKDGKASSAEASGLQKLLGYEETTKTTGGEYLETKFYTKDENGKKTYIKFNEVDYTDLKKINVDEATHVTTYTATVIQDKTTITLYAEDIFSATKTETVKTPIIAKPGTFAVRDAVAKLTYKVPNTVNLNKADGWGWDVDASVENINNVADKYFYDNLYKDVTMSAEVFAGGFFNANGTKKGMIKPTTALVSDPTTVAVGSFTSGVAGNIIIPFKTTLNPKSWVITTYDSKGKAVKTPIAENDVIAAIGGRKDGGNYYTRPIAVINDAIANHEHVTFTFTSYAGYVATEKSKLMNQWVTIGAGYDYETSGKGYDWHNPTFGQHLYTTIDKSFSSKDDSYALMDVDITQYDQYGSYLSGTWATNLFTGAIVVNKDITMQLSDTAAFEWGTNTLTFDWNRMVNDENRVTEAKEFLTSMLFYTPVDWYWDSLSVVVAADDGESIDAGEGLDGEGDVIDDEEPADIVDEPETEPEVVETEPEVVETEAAPVDKAPSPSTGNAPVALAVIPVALAAAAVVAKKRG